MNPTLPRLSTLEPRVERILEAYRDRAFRLALRIVGCAELAEDVTQDALLRAAKRHQDAQPEAEWLWLRKIVIRRSISALNSRRARAPFPEYSAAGERLTEAFAVRQVLAKLKPDQRALLALAIGEKLAYEEIALMLEIPVGTVASRLHSAKEAFRKLWEDRS